MMGLDTSHGCWHGAYSAFMRWRQKLAEVANYPPLLMMEGFYDPSAWWFMTPGFKMNMLAEVALQKDEKGRHSGPLSFFAAESIALLPISWKPFQHDPLWLLLRHSDCDGEIASEDCGPIADRLEQLLPLMPEGDGGGHIRDWRQTTQRFIGGLRLAASLGEAVRFH